MSSIIFKTKFRSPEENRSFIEEIKYSTQEYKQQSIKGLKHEDYESCIDNENVDFTKVIDYSTEIYKQKSKKYFKENNNYTFSNFSNNINKNDIENIKKIFEHSQKNGSFLYKTYISFEDGYLEKHNIINNGFVNENLLKIAIRNSMIKLLNSENIKDYTFIGNIHYDTDNIHLHVYTVENGTPTRKINYNTNDLKERYKSAKFKITSFKKAKSEIHKSLNKDYENLKEIQNIFKNKILKTNINFQNFSEEELGTLKNIYNKLPANKNLWQFNNKRIKHIKSDLKEFTKNYLNKYHKEKFDNLNKILEKQEKEFNKIYGNQKNYIFKNKISNNYKKNKLEEIYSRTANKLLKELKEIDLVKLEEGKKQHFSNIKLYNFNKKNNKENKNYKYFNNNLDINDTNITKMIPKKERKNIKKNTIKNKKINKKNKLKINKKFKDYTKYIKKSKKREINLTSASKIFRNLSKNIDKNLKKEMINNIIEYQKLIKKIDYKNKNINLNLII